jgi:hypothetical protein
MLINPLIIPPALFGVLALSSGESSAWFWRVLGISTFLYFIVPVTYLLVLQRVGTIESIEARDRSRREKPLFWGAILLFAFVPIVGVSMPGEPTLYVLIAAILATNALILSAITRSVKISIHLSGVAGLFSIVWGLYVNGFIPAIPGGMGFLVFSATLIPIVGWARLTTDAHSRREIIWGGLFGLLMPLAELWVASVFLIPQ